jgi:hypothetical protein
MHVGQPFAAELMLCGVGERLEPFARRKIRVDVLRLDTFGLCFCAARRERGRYE